MLYDPVVRYATLASVQFDAVLCPIHTADADETKLFCRVASASAVCTWIRDDCRRIRRCERTATQPSAVTQFTTAVGCVHTDDTTKLSPTSCEFVYTPPTRRDSTVSSRRRRRCVLGFTFFNNPSVVFLGNGGTESLDVTWYDVVICYMVVYSWGNWPTHTVETTSVRVRAETPVNYGPLRAHFATTRSSGSHTKLVIMIGI